MNTPPRQSPTTKVDVCDVLVIEDDLVIRDQLSELFERSGMRVAGVANGRDALDFVRSRPVRVLVIDLMLPVMSGWELVKQLDAQPELARIPRLFMTAVSNVNRCPPGPVFLKPLDMASLTRAVKTLVAASKHPT